MESASSDCEDRKIYKLPDLIRLYPVSRSSIYRAMENDDFPQPIKLTGRSVGWWRHQVEEWFANRPSGISPCADHAQYQTESYLTSRPKSKAA
ncbi:MAG: helix-turn-helix transcriptional regulator [Sphingomicrobium sp.]